MGWNDLIGTPFGDEENAYEIEEEIARGGMSRVFRARDMRHERDVALKVMALGGDSGDGPSFTKRFEHEAHAVERLDHPNIVKVFATGRTDEFVYIAMQLVLGGTFRQKLGRPMPIADACFQMIQMAKALHHAHMHHVIHRDVKPANMLIDDRDPSHLLLADFGIAKIMGQKGVTKTGTAVGTPEYMAPEQAKGEEIDPRADIYGLACVLYEALAGRPPFVGPTALSICYQHVHTRPAYIRGFNPEVPRALALVIEQALAKNPRDRFASAEDFANALYPFTVSDGRSLPTMITGGLDLRGTPVPDSEERDPAEVFAPDVAAISLSNPAPVEAGARLSESAGMLDLSTLGTRPAPTPMPIEDDATTQQTQELAPVMPLSRPRHTRPVQPSSIRLKSRPVTRPHEGDVATPSGGFALDDVAHLSTVQTPVTPHASDRIPPPTGPTRATKILERTPQSSRIRLIIVIIAAFLVGLLTLFLVSHAHSGSGASTSGVVSTTQPTLAPAATPTSAPTTQPTAHPSPQATTTPPQPTTPPGDAATIITGATITLTADKSCTASNNLSTVPLNKQFIVNACEQGGKGSATILARINDSNGFKVEDAFAVDQYGNGGGYTITEYPLHTPGSYSVVVEWNGAVARTIPITVK